MTISWYCWYLAIKSTSFIALHWNFIYLNIDVCDFCGGWEEGVLQCLKSTVREVFFLLWATAQKQVTWLFFFPSDGILKINNQPKPSKQKKPQTLLQKTPWTNELRYLNSLGTGKQGYRFACISLQHKIWVLKGCFKMLLFCATDQTDSFLWLNLWRLQSCYRLGQDLVPVFLRHQDYS